MEALANFTNTSADKWRRAKPFIAAAFLLILCPLCACSLWFLGFIGGQ